MSRLPYSLSDDYKLTWSDDFSGTELDRAKWNYHGLGPRGNAYVVEDCAELDGEGHLVLTTRRNGKRIETAIVSTEQNFQTTFGYFESRMKFQTQPGHWSAFWLQSATMAKIGDPKTNGAEIDIIELFSTDRETMFMNVHWNGYGKEHQKVGSSHKDESLKKGWHVVGLEWTPKEYRFFLDGREVWRTNESVSRAKQYILFSLECRKWAGDIARAKLPDSVLIDYVRVYQRTTTP